MVASKAWGVALVRVLTEVSMRAAHFIVQDTDHDGD
jgi:hypothetical protein